MVEDLEALNRRTNLPIRMVQDRPHQQKEELLWEEIQEEDEEMRTQEENKKKYTFCKTTLALTQK